MQVKHNYLLSTVNKKITWEQTLIWNDVILEQNRRLIFTAWLVWISGSSHGSVFEFPVYRVPNEHNFKSLSTEFGFHQTNPKRCTMQPNTHDDIQTHTYTLYTYPHLHAHTCTNIYSYTYIYTHVNTQILIYTNINTYTHMHAYHHHTLTHTSIHN